MARPKASAPVAGSTKIPFGKQEAVSTIPAVTANKPFTNVKILFQGTCPKLTTRGAGELSYELGIDDATGNSYVRISANASSGAFSHEWLGIGHIRTMLELKNEQQQTFAAAVLNTLFVKRSSNNYGYLAAILKAEGVLVALVGQTTLLRLGTWEPLLQKIDSLNEQGVNLPDNIAIAAQKRAEKKAQLMTKMRPEKTPKAVSKPAEMNPQDDPFEDNELHPQQATGYQQQQKKTERKRSKLRGMTP